MINFTILIFPLSLQGTWSNQSIPGWFNTMGLLQFFIDCVLNVMNTIQKFVFVTVY